MCWSAVGSSASIAYVMEGISLYGATPRLGVIPASSFIIPASRITNDAPSIAGFPIADEIFMPVEVRTQGFVGSESAIDSGVTPKICTNVNSVVDHGVRAKGTSASTAATFADGEHLDNIGEFEFPTPFFW